MNRVLDRAEIERFRGVVAERFGLCFDDGRLAFLGDVLQQRMELAGRASVDAYLHFLTLSDAEFAGLAEQLTVNETFFFRNADNFRALVEVVLPERIRANASGRRLRLLSAGCASGDEPYSLAIALREALPDLASWDVRIVALDISQAMLTKAQNARYSAWALRATSDDYKRRYFRAEGRDFVLAPDIRKMVSFEQRNLIDDDPMFWGSLAYDVVFCRNVLMYFAPDKARAVVKRLGEAMLPGGFFFMGHAETLRGLSHELSLCHTHDTFYYCKGAESERASLALMQHPSEREHHASSSLPAATEPTTSWFEVIQRASERIANLADGRGQPGRVTSATNATSAAPLAKRSWDLEGVLDAMQQERFSHALELISALPADAQSDPDALLLQAVLLTNLGKLAESEQVCRRLLAIDELHAGAHYLMALCRAHVGDATRAIEHDQAAIYLDASFAMPHVHLGIMAKRAGDTSTAQRKLRQALILVAREEPSRVVLFGGGFSREMLMDLCRTQLLAVGGDA